MQGQRTADRLRLRAGGSLATVGMAFDRFGTGLRLRLIGEVSQSAAIW
jgi:hypothetical protein